MRPQQKTADFKALNSIKFHLHFLTFLLLHGNIQRKKTPGVTVPQMYLML